MLPVLRDLRVPIVTLAVLCMVFQVIVPVTASASPKLLEGVSICFGAPDMGGKWPGSVPVHAATCICGQICPHAGLAKSPPLAAVGVAEQPDVRIGRATVSPSDWNIGRAGFLRPLGRAPPFVS